MANPLLKTLRDSAKGLLFSSESDRPLVAFVWPKAEVGPTLDTAALLRLLQRDPATPVTTVALDSFFSPMSTAQVWHNDEEKANAQRFQALVSTLNKELTGAQAYRLGAGPVFEVYVVGTTPTGDYAGVRTQLTET